MKILNLYAGIGGNRKLWGDNHDITAVEIDEDIASIYSDYFPEDEVVVDDAHEYLEKNYDKGWDFIWSSPPCPTHSDIRRTGVYRGQNRAVYPDMTLYQEVILLLHFAPKETKWCVENVKPYYKPLMPAQELHRHLFWTNYLIRDMENDSDRTHGDIKGTSTVYGFNISEYGVSNKRKVLRNLVDPELGKHVFDEAFKQGKTLLD